MSTPTAASRRLAVLALVSLLPWLVLLALQGREVLAALERRAAARSELAHELVRVALASGMDSGDPGLARAREALVHGTMDPESRRALSHRVERLGRYLEAVEAFEALPPPARGELGETLRQLEREGATRLEPLLRDLREHRGELPAERVLEVVGPDPATVDELRGLLAGRDPAPALDPLEVVAVAREDTPRARAHEWLLGAFAYLVALGAACAGIRILRRPPGTRQLPREAWALALLTALASSLGVLGSPGPHPAGWWVSALLLRPLLLLALASVAAAPGRRSTPGGPRPGHGRPGRGAVPGPLGRGRELARCPPRPPPAAGGGPPGRPGPGPLPPHAQAGEALARAIEEEVIFRGALAAALTASGLPGPGVGLLTAGSWALLHAGNLDPWWARPLLLLPVGLLLHLLRRRQGLLTAILAHGLWNLAAVLL